MAQKTVGSARVFIELDNKKFEVKLDKMGKNFKASINGMKKVGKLFYNK